MAIKTTSNLRKVMVDTFSSVCVDTHLRIGINNGRVKIDIVDGSDNEIFHMDNQKIPHIRKSYNYRYKCPIVIDVSTSVA